MKLGQRSRLGLGLGDRMASVSYAPVSSASLFIYLVSEVNYKN